MSCACWTWRAADPDRPRAVHGHRALACTVAPRRVPSLLATSCTPGASQKCRIQHAANSKRETRQHGPCRTARETRVEQQERDAANTVSTAQKDRANLQPARAEFEAMHIVSYYHSFNVSPAHLHIHYDAYINYQSGESSILIPRRRRIRLYNRAWSSYCWVRSLNSQNSSMQLDFEVFGGEQAQPDEQL